MLKRPSSQRDDRDHRARELAPAEHRASQHVGGITTQPEEYERCVIGFFDRALLNR